MRTFLRFAAAALLASAMLSCQSGPKDGTYTFHILTTNDVHGTYFDQSYVDESVRPSMFAVNYYVDSVRNAVGEENVILIDAGDHLQGDNAAYYYNYIETGVEHVWTRIVDYMKYDVNVLGNHDVETAHPVYDRITEEMANHKIPYLGGNAIRNDNGQPYWPKYTVLKRNGVKILVLGYTNPNMKAWLNESVWSGMHFESLIPMVQQDVDAIVSKENPQVVIVAVHSGTGSGDGSVLESQGLDLFKSLKGVDFIICSHDHRPDIEQSEEIVLLNSGSHARNVAHGEITVSIKDGKVSGKKLSGSLIPVSADKTDPVMKAVFQKDYDAVKEFTLKEVGELKGDLVLSDALFGMSDYMAMIQTVCMKSTGAQLCFAAPLSSSGVIKGGILKYNDLFTLYRYENQLYTVNIKGSEVKNYLEYSYDNWIQTISSPNQHILKIAPRDDARYGTRGWSFVGATYNFDSCAGINYVVDVTKPFGERIQISSLADGSAFDMDAMYTVAMTSYRASGGGDIMPKGAGIDSELAEQRTVSKMKEIRELMYDYLQEYGSFDPAVFTDESLIGHWEFGPAAIAGPAMAADKALMTR